MGSSTKTGIWSLIWALTSTQSISDAFEGRIVWDLPMEDCATQVSRIFIGPGKVHLHQDEKGWARAVVFAKEVSTGQYAGFHLCEPKACCGWHCFTTQIPGMAVCPVGEGSDGGGFSFRQDVGADLRATQLLSQLGYLHIDTNQQMQGRFTQAQDGICQVELANYRTRLQTLAGTDNPYARPVRARQYTACGRSSCLHYKVCGPQCHLGRLR